FEHGSQMVREHHDRRMERRVVAPPPLPLIVLPGATLVAELVASHDLDANPRSPLTGEGVVDATTAVWLALHLTEGPGSEEPLVQSVIRVPERCFEALPFPSTESVKAYGEVVDAYE